MLVLLFFPFLWFFNFLLLKSQLKYTTTDSDLHKLNKHESISHVKYSSTCIRLLFYRSQLELVRVIGPYPTYSSSSCMATSSAMKQFLLIGKERWHLLRGMDNLVVVYSRSASTFCADKRR